MMKKIKYILLLAILTLAGFGCKKFLDVTPIDNLSGNTFWKTKKDVEGYANGLYVLFKQEVGVGGFSSVADLRCAPILGNAFISRLQNNDLRGLQSNNTEWDYGHRLQRNTRWGGFFNIVAGANIMVKKIDEVEDPNLSDTERKQYKAEAIFVRNLCYFFMVRLYGDVPYYTNAFNQKPLPRTPMVTVLNNCIADLNAVKDDLPWTYSDPSKVGVRAMRGGAIALLMHMNMWAAGFDADANKPVYYNAVKQLGLEIETSTDYGLLPYNEENYKRIFKGRTKESLFEVYQNSNTGEKLDPRSNVGYLLSHYPLLGTINKITSTGYYSKEWIAKIYDASSDGRKDLWFDNREAGNNDFQFKKFANVYADGLNILNDDDIIIFRLPDAYLLAAEANAALEQDDEAKRYLNLVRSRANAIAITSSGTTLKDDIYKERVRELMGEGHYYYDLVRTKRILDEDYCIRPMAVTAFNAGAWTWPIDADALLENPFMVLNNYWR
jgi:hypothetical protein